MLTTEKFERKTLSISLGEEILYVFVVELRRRQWFRVMAGFEMETPLSIANWFASWDFR